MGDANSTLGRFERQCATCGKLFRIGTGRGQARKYCDRACAPKVSAPTKLCDVEGCDRIARSDSAPHCEMHYYRVRRSGSLGTPGESVGAWPCCQYCGGESEGRRFCDSRCAARSIRGTPRLRSCTVCGAEYDPRTNSGMDFKVCGAECKASRGREWSRLQYMRGMSTPEGRDRIRRAEYKRKALKRAAFVEEVSRDEVMRRSNWRCHLCRGRIPPDAVWPSPLFGTVDHVLPLAQGGAHSYANCKAAHLTCNCKKGAKPQGQLGLPLSA